MINCKVLFAALCLSTSTVFAVPFNGFYVGAGIGGSQAKFDTKQSFTLNPTVDGASIVNIVVQNNTDLTDTSLLGNLNIGYGHVFAHNFFLGVEADANFQSLETAPAWGIRETQSTFNIQANSKTELHTALSLTLDPGFVFNQTTLFYGKIGPAWGDFSTRVAANYSQTLFADNTLAANTSTHDSGYESGLLLGLGIEHYVSNNLSMKLEYTHINYGNIGPGDLMPGAITITNPAVTAGGTIAGSSNADASSNQVVLGLAYHLA